MYPYIEQKRLPRAHHICMRKPAPKFGYINWTESIKSQRAGLFNYVGINMETAAQSVCTRVALCGRSLAINNAAR